jgi:hypothetical protein
MRTMVTDARIINAEVSVFKAARLSMANKPMRAAVEEFADAVRAEAFESMRAEAERRFETNASEPGFGPSGQAIAYGRLADWAKRQAEKARGGK